MGTFLLRALAAAVAAAPSAFDSSSSSSRPEGLRCNFVDAKQRAQIPAKGRHPQLSWEPQAQQTAFRIVASSTSAGIPNAADLWDSGKITSPLSVAVYAGSVHLVVGNASACWSVQLWTAGSGEPSTFAAPAPLQTDPAPP